MNAEQHRLAFLETRDGVEGALEFAKRTYAIYRSALKMSRKRKSPKIHFASTPEYRRSYVESCLVFRAYIREHKHDVFHADVQLVA